MGRPCCETVALISVLAFAQITPLVRKRRHDATAHREREEILREGAFCLGFSKGDTNEWASYPFHSS
jgi:hypothetical protein